jgi:energy-coupling factor transport system substrate-specific component
LSSSVQSRHPSGTRLPRSARYRDFRGRSLPPEGGWAGGGARVALVAAAAAAFAAAIWTAVDREHAGLSLLLVAAAAIAAGVAWIESGPDSAKEVALVATLGGAAAAGRVLFAAIPGVQPVTVITVAAGAALGARAGVAVGGIAALVSNFFLGQGVWTPWQMLGWGFCGVAGALAAPLLRRRTALAVYCFGLGVGFSALMDVWNWIAFYDEHTWATFVSAHARGFPFDLAHGIGNVVIAVVAGPELRRLLARYGRRLHAEVNWT